MKDSPSDALATEDALEREGVAGQERLHAPRVARRARVQAVGERVARGLRDPRAKRGRVGRPAREIRSVAQGEQSLEVRTLDVVPPRDAKEATERARRLSRRRRHRATRTERGGARTRREGGRGKRHAPIVTPVEQNDGE